MIVMDIWKNPHLFFKLDKAEFYGNLNKLYSSHLIILEQFKKDFNIIDIYLNGKKISSYSIFLEYILKYYNTYLEKILLVCSKSIFINIIQFIKTQYNNIHIIPDMFDRPVVHINLNYIIKQIYITNTYKLIILDEHSNIILKTKINIQIIIDMTNIEPIILTIQ